MLVAVGTDRRFLSRLLSGGAETVERPAILRFVVAEDIEIPVIGAHAKVACFGGVPPPIQLVDFKLPSTQDEPHRPLIGSMPRVAFDAHLVHRASAEWKGPTAGEFELQIQSSSFSSSRKPPELA